MIDFSACLELMFLEDDRALDDRVRAAADSGFRAVEIWDWWDKDLPRLERALRETGTTLLTLCVEGWRDKCDLGDPASHDEFVRRTITAARTAQELGTPKLVVLAGDRVPGAPLEVQRLHAVTAVQRAAEAAAEHGVQLVLEVVNRRDEGPNALVADTRTAVQVVEAVGHPSAALLYDRYHAILNGEAIGQDLAGRVPLIGHVQAADVPGRHEFGSGDVDWAAEFAWLAAEGYDGWIGIEGTPLVDSSRVLAHARTLLP